MNSGQRKRDHVLNKQGLHSTGETVFGDKALRFRDLSIPIPEDPSPIDPANFVSGFKIRLAKLSKGRSEAITLVENRYGSVGYAVPHPNDEPHLLTFSAYDEGILVGTVGLRLDSYRGLAADELYPAEVEQMRKSGGIICEFTRLAVNSSAASRPVLAGLFHTAYLYGYKVHGCTHAVIEVTPQHSAYYRRALGFERIGSERLNPRVNTQGVLMCVAFTTIAEGIARFAGKPDVPGAMRSLFVYGFPPDEEAGVLSRLRNLV
jgi:hypothetical protein